MRVLFCAYTHAAVDNGLLRVLQNAPAEDLKILRLGQAAKVHEKIKPFMLEGRSLETTQQ